MTHIYVSPHADDAALSCGGQIISHHAVGTKVVILNVFSSEGAYKPIDPAWAEDRFPDAINSDRTEEDRLAWKSIGVEAQNANFPEAIIRKQFPFLLVRNRPDDILVESIQKWILGCLKPYSCPVLHAPAGIGNHIDHIACRMAVLNLLKQGIVDSVILYEDIPYSWLGFIRRRYYKSVINRDYRNAGGGIERAELDGLTLRRYLRSGLVPFPRGRKLFAAIYLWLLITRLVSVRPRRRPKFDIQLTTRFFNSDLADQKRRLISQYKSQLAMLFGDEPDATMDKYSHLLASETSITVTRGGS